MSHLICLSPDEVETRLRKLGIPVGFTTEEKEFLNTIPVVDSPRRIFAFPVPADQAGLNLMNLSALCGTDPSEQPSFFDHPWYQYEEFMRTNCSAGWHFIHMDVLPGSTERPLHYVRSLEGLGIVLPSAIEVTLMLFLHFAGTGEQLLHKKHTWCSDLASMGRSVTVGAFGRNGLFISGQPPSFSSRGLGICGKVRLTVDLVG